MASDTAPLALADLRMLPPTFRVVELDAAGAPGAAGMSGPVLTPSPSVTQLAALAQLIAQRDPALMPAFLHCLCSSSRAERKCRTRKPSAEELDGLRKLPHGAVLLGSYRAGTAWLERRREELAAALDRAIPPIGGGSRPRPKAEGEGNAD